MIYFDDYHIGMTFTNTALVPGMAVYYQAVQFEQVDKKIGWNVFSC